MPLVFRLGLCSTMLATAAAAAQPPNGTLNKAQNVRRQGDAAVQGPSDDVVCELLFQQYVLGAKIPTDDLNAAIHLIAVRGRTNGFWTQVLAEFERSFAADDPHGVGRHTLAVLTKMLGDDGNTRWMHERPRLLESSAVALHIGLPDEVLDRVIARAADADRLRFDSYVIAVQQAYDRRGQPFLLEVLTPAAPIDHSDAQFHAAVGLAELGEEAGIEWLIAHTDSQGGITRAAHALAARGALSENCRQALADLTGQPSSLSKAQWQRWRAAQRTRFVPINRVRLRLP